jgi:phosphomannomutase
MARVNLKVSVSGVRGTVGDALTPSLIAGFATAFGEYVGGGRVIVGRDTRPSGPMYERAVVAGLLSVGCQPVLLGVVPTPTVQIMVDEYKANGGIIITASHNPAEWNALKLIGASGIFLNHTEAAELLDIYNQSDHAYVPEDEYRNLRTVENAFEVQKKRIFEQVDCKVIRDAGLKVAIDCCNGAGAPYDRAFLEELGCEVVALFEETDGIFRRAPEPVAENISELSKTVVEQKCDIGFAQDPDADRIVVVGADGVPVGEQYSVVLAAEHLLSKTPGPVVVNVQTTKALADVAAKYGCEAHFTPVGEINVTSKMLETSAVIGGEGGSGGIIFPAVHPCRDSFTGMALILEMMAMRKQGLAQIFEGIPRYLSAGTKVPCSPVRAVGVIRSLTAKYADANPVTIDGLRLDWDDAWVLIRASNTEPIVRVFAEALEQERADALVAQFVAEIEG